MKIDNETDDDIDYNQTGGGGSDDDVLAAIEGSLPPGAEVLFSPEGTTSYLVRLTLPTDSEVCCEVTLTDPEAAITVHDLTQCRITVSQQGASIGPCQAS